MAIENVIDRAIGIFAPRAALRRAASRTAISELAAYSGATRTRLTSDWVASKGSADQDIITDLSLLRERSRDLIRNDGYAAGIVRTIVYNDVGSGIKPQSRIDPKAAGISQSQAEDLQQQAEDAWAEWSESADVTGHHTFETMQALVDRQVLENGESIILPIYVNRPDSEFTFCLQAVESDRLDSPMGFGLSNADIRSGVEVDGNGCPVAYWISKSHPGDYASWLRNRNEYTRVPAFDSSGRKNLFHLFTQERPGQSRGVPFLSPVLLIFRDIGKYREAELVAARLAACVAMIITTEGAYDAATNAATSTVGTQRREALEPGIIERLNPGQGMETFNPSRPNSNFEPFLDSLLRYISAACCLPYELVAKDFRKATYTSSRASLLEARKYFRIRQNWLIDQLCKPAWWRVLEEAYLNGKFKAPGDFYTKQKAYSASTWIPPGWEWVDPEKEIKASILAVTNNMSTLAQETSRQGGDWEDLVRQRSREKALLEELGLTMPGVGAQRGYGNTNPDDNTGGEDDKDDDKNKE